MFYRSERGNLCCGRSEKLDFEVQVLDLIAEAKPRSAKELTFVVECLCEALLQAARDHAEDEMGLDDWEDPYFSAQ